MKLHPPTDPGKVFDDLSVLAIKVAKTTGSAPAAANYATVAVPISGELGDRYGQPLFTQIIQSVEYSGLYDINLRLFDLIDHLKSPQRDPNICYDTVVDQINHDRWKWKAALQTRFFPESPLSEMKLGYGENGSTCSAK